MKVVLFEIGLLRENKEAERTCHDCIYCISIMGGRSVCNYWMVGFDMRGGYEPCEYFTE